MPVTCAAQPIGGPATVAAASTLHPTSTTITSTPPQNIIAVPSANPLSAAAFPDSEEPMVAVPACGASNDGMPFVQDLVNAQESTCGPTNRLVPRYLSPISLMPCLQTYHHSLDALFFSLAKMDAEGRLDRSRLSSMMKGWGVYSSRHGMDFTFGTMGTLAHFLGLHGESGGCGSVDPSAGKLEQLCEGEASSGLSHHLPCHITKVSETKHRSKKE